MEDKSDSSDSSKSFEAPKPLNYVLPSINKGTEFPIFPLTQPFLQPQQPTPLYDYNNPISSIPPIILETKEEKSYDNTTPEEAKRKSHSIAEKKRRDTINQKIKDVYSMISSEKSPSKVVSLQRILDYVENLCEHSKNIKRKISEAEEENEILKKQNLEFKSKSNQQEKSISNAEDGEDGQLKDVPEISISKKVGENEVILSTNSPESHNDEKKNDDDKSSSESENQSKKIAFLGLFIFLVFLFPSFKGMIKQYGTRTILEYTTISYDNLFAELIIGLLIQVVISTLVLILTCITISFLVNVTFFWNEIPSKYGGTVQNDNILQCKHNFDIKEKEKFYRKLDEESNYLITILLSLRIYVYIMEKLWMGRIVDRICLILIRLNILSCKWRQKKRIFKEFDVISKNMKVWESLMYYEISRIFESKQALYLANNLFCMINDDNVFI